VPWSKPGGEAYSNISVPVVSTEVAKTPEISEKGGSGVDGETNRLKVTAKTVGGASFDKRSLGDGENSNDGKPPRNAESAKEKLAREKLLEVAANKEGRTLLGICALCQERSVIRKVLRL